VRDSPGRVVATNTVYVGAGLYADYASALLISILVARHLDPDAYGTYALIVWAAAVGALVANHGLVTGVMKFVSEARGRNSPELAWVVLRRFERLQQWSCLASCALLAAVIALPRRMIFPDVPPRLWWIILPALALRCLYVFYLSAAKGYENFRLVARVQSIVAAIGVAIVGVAVTWGVGLEGLLHAFVLVSLVYALSMRFGFFRAIRRPPAANAEPPIGRIYRHVAYAAGIVLLDVVILRQPELLFLDRFSTRESIAYYGIGRSLSDSAVLLIPGIATTLLLPMMSRTYGENPALLGGRFLAATRYILILTVPIVILCEIFATDVIALLYGAEYGAAGEVLRVAVVAAAVGAVSASASSYQLGSDRQAAIVGIMAVVGVVSLVLKFELIRRFELRGAIGASAASAVLLGVAILWHARNDLRVRFDSSTYIRIIGAGLASAAPALVVQATLPVWAALPVGSLLSAVSYLLLTLMLGAWSRADVEAMRVVADIIPSRLGRPISALIQRAASATTLVPKEV
jgi:O-antigen/teichoic acid export membrane protein